MSAPVNLERRDFLRTSSALAGGLVLSFHLPAASAAASGKPAALLNAWIRIAPDDSVTLYSNISELGQGTGSAIAQMIAEELEVEWKSIRLEMAPLAKTYFTTPDNYYTDGSRGVSSQFEKMRKVGATARILLVQAAAAQWQVAPDTCSATAGAVTHGASGRSLRYGALADAAAALPVPATADVKLKPREAWRLIGTAPQRLDIPPKVDGSAVYGIDVQLPGMLVATIAHSPVFGGALGSVNEKAAMALRGVRKVVKLDGAVAVIADSYWHAKKGLDALKPQWQVAATVRSTPALTQQLKASALLGEGIVDGPEADALEASKAFAVEVPKAVRTKQALYEFPFLAHATMEPMNGTAQVFADRAELWLPTQAQLDSRTVTAQELKLAPEQVTVNTTLCGGGFGRRDQVDFVLDAVRVARAMPGVPVKLIWSRAEDMQHGYYRPACALRVTASIGADGLPCALAMHSSGTVIMGDRPYMPVDRSKLNGGSTFASAMDFNIFGNVYGVGAMLITVKDEDMGVPVGYWRSVGASQNVFALESFIDELAHAAGADPLAYRHKLRSLPVDNLRLPKGMDPAVALKRLADSRALIGGVLDAVVKLSGWDRPRKPGHFMGIAVGRPGGTYVAQVAEVSVDAQKKVTLHALSCAVDCGTAVNPQNIRAQIEGAMIFGLSAAMFGAITIKDGRVEQSNFHDYPIMTMAQTPQIRIEILEKSPRVCGIGESGTSLAGPALANAIFAATGARITALPMLASGFTFA